MERCFLRHILTGVIETLSHGVCVVCVCLSVCVYQGGVGGENECLAAEGRAGNKRTVISSCEMVLPAAWWNKQRH